MNCDMMEEINHRVKLAWSALGRSCAILKGSLPLCLKKKIFDQCILPILTYTAETWTLTKRAIRKLQVTQRSMERCMIGITKLDKKRNQWIRNQTKVIDVIDRVKTLKWKWAGHVARRTDDKKKYFSGFQGVSKDPEKDLVIGGKMKLESLPELIGGERH